MAAGFRAVCFFVGAIRSSLTLAAVRASLPGALLGALFGGFLAGATSIAAAQSSSVLMADPLPLNNQETLFFYEGGGQRVNWRTGRQTLVDLFAPVIRDRQGYRQRYTLVANGKGVWMIGPVVALLQPDGRRHSIKFIDDVSANPISGATGGQLVAVGLDDDSVLILGRPRGNNNYETYRVRLEGMLSRELKLRQLASVPKIGYGAAAIKLPDGRVLVTGGQYSDKQAWLYDPKRDAWTRTGDMNTGRIYMAQAVLPDGRVFVAGTGWMSAASDSNNVRTGAVYGAELWDPRTGRWESLPPMPLSFKINAYYATQPSAAVLPDGSIVVGGGMHRHAVLLRARGKGFADRWAVVGTLPEQRISGIVQALGNNEIVISGGVGPVEKDRGCCRDRPGGTLIAWNGDGILRAQSISLPRRDAAVAHRGDYTFAAGGWETFFLSSQETQASSVAELFDRKRKQVRELPPLPQPMFAGRAMWIDDDRVLVKGIAQSALYGRPFRGMDGRSLEVYTSGYLAVFSLRENRWRTLDDPRLARAELAGIRRGEAVLIEADARVWTVSLDTFAVGGLPPAILHRSEGAAGVFADGRIVVAGGFAQSQTVEATDADCREANCPLRPFGYGSLAPSYRVEIFDPAAKAWRFGTPSQSAGVSAVIRSDGRVVQLGQLRQSGNARSDSDDSKQSPWMIEESDASVSKWRQRPLPTGVNAIETRDGNSCGRGAGEAPFKCILLIAPLPTGGDRTFLLRERWANEPRFDLWVYDDVSAQWRSLAADLPAGALMAGDPLTVSEGTWKIRGAYFQPQKVLLWTE